MLLLVIDNEVTHSRVSKIRFDGGYLMPGAVARSKACPLGLQAAPSLFLTSGTFFLGDLVMKRILRPFSLFR